MELQRNLDSIRQQGLGLAAISYDSAAVLKNFAGRQHITYPLLSDSDSRIIRSFHILNDTMKPGTVPYGIPYPGTYLLDAQGKVVSKYFEDDFKERVSTGAILARQFGIPLTAARNTAGTKHLQVTTAAGSDIARAGVRVALSLDIQLNPGMHAYAPGVKGYIPIDWQLEQGGPAAKKHSYEYPPSETLHLAAIHETVPVYRGHIRIIRDITFAQDAALKPLVSPSGELIVKGSLRYQACDDRQCFVPRSLPLEWHFKYEGLDRQRVPPELQRKAN